MASTGPENAAGGLAYGWPAHGNGNGNGVGDAQSGRQQTGERVANPLGREFEIFEWHVAYQSCQRYFLDHAQHEQPVQAVAALVNILLPFQWPSNPVSSYLARSRAVVADAESTGFEQLPRPGSVQSAAPQRDAAVHCVSLTPYIRRLVVTAFDREAVLHGFFGNDWKRGVEPLQECERRNYMFAAKSGGWAKVKDQYDMGPRETVPFLQPPQNVGLAEIENAEKQWSQWLATEDWMIGPRAPESTQGYARGAPNASQSSSDPA